MSPLSSDTTIEELDVKLCGFIGFCGGFCEKDRIRPYRDLFINHKKDIIDAYSYEIEDSKERETRKKISDT